MARFRLKLPSSNSEFCIATTHILYNPKAGDVKLAQLCLLLAELHKIASSGGDNRTIPAILCGDLNSLPQSPLIKFVERSSLDYSKMYAEDLAGYQSSRSHHRTIPVPILNRSLSIGQDCRYKSTLSSDDVIDLTVMSPSPFSPKNLLQPGLNGGIDLNDFPSLLGFPSEPTVEQSTLAPPTFLEKAWSKIVTLNPMIPPDAQAPLHSSAQAPPSLLSSQGPPPSLHPSAQTPTSSSFHTQAPRPSAQTPTSSSFHTQAPHPSAQTPTSSSFYPSAQAPPPPSAQTSNARSAAIISHPFHFVSAYPIPSGNQPSPVVTTFHGKACEMVDYIFFTPLKSNKGIQLVNRKALPSTHTLNQIGPQPNKHFPSDHLYLQVEFQLVD